MFLLDMGYEPLDHEALDYSEGLHKKSYCMGTSSMSASTLLIKNAYSCTATEVQVYNSTSAHI